MISRLVAYCLSLRGDSAWVLRKIDALDGCDHYCGRPAKHDDAVGRLKGTEKTPVFSEKVGLT